jgi:O-acetyl-ADP-ribose deacetylase (regulator of RNase III)
MRVPEPVGGTLNAYLAFRATLLAIRDYNAQHSSRIGTVVVPGFGTGYGAMDPRRCAAQMRIALNQVMGSPDTPSFHSIHKTHELLRTT